MQLFKVTGAYAQIPQLRPIFEAWSEDLQQAAGRNANIVSHLNELFRTAMTLQMNLYPETAKEILDEQCPVNASIRASPTASFARSVHSTHVLSVILASGRTHVQRMVGLFCRFSSREWSSRSTFLTLREVRTCVLCSAKVSYATRKEMLTTASKACSTDCCGLDRNLTCLKMVSYTLVTTS
eukprot:6184686-Prymnesium_polylepis.2